MHFGHIGGRLLTMDWLVRSMLKTTQSCITFTYTLDMSRCSHGDTKFPEMQEEHQPCI